MKLEDYKKQYKEEWRSLIYDKFNGEYEISNYGSIRNRSKRVLKLEKIHTGYYSIHLYASNYKKRISVHRLVALTFIEKPEGWNEDWQVDHIDGDKTNNNPTNLEWVSCKENILRSIKNGFRTTKYDPEKVMEICEYLANKVSKNDTLQSIADQFNVEKALVESIYNRRRWKFLSELYPEFIALSSNRCRPEDVIEDLCKFILENKNKSDNYICEEFNKKYPDIERKIKRTMVSEIRHKKSYTEISDKYFKGKLLRGNRKQCI